MLCVKKKACFVNTAFGVVNAYKFSTGQATHWITREDKTRKVWTVAKIIISRRTRLLESGGWELEYEFFVLV